MNNLIIFNLYFVIHESNYIKIYHTMNQNRNIDKTKQKFDIDS